MPAGHSHGNAWWWGRRTQQGRPWLAVSHSPTQRSREAAGQRLDVSPGRLAGLQLQAGSSGAAHGQERERGMQAGDEVMAQSDYALVMA